MEKILLSVLKEVGIAIGILVVLAAAIVLAFKDQLPYDEEIRTGEEYVKADMKNYSVSSSDRLSEVKAVTVTHEADSNQIVEAENEVRVQTGKYTPFGNIQNTSDLPTEKVGVTVKIDDTTDNTNSATEETTTTENENLEYPVTDDSVKKIETEQSESAESAANRRFNNED